MVKRFSDDEVSHGLKAELVDQRRGFFHLSEDLLWKM
jgi:hypothetical protein